MNRLKQCDKLPVAVVGCRPDCKDSFIEVPLVALHDQLMGPADQVDVIGCIELGHDVAAKQVTSTTWTHTPTLHI